MNLLTFALGFLFGAALQYARLNRYDVISGLARREDFTVPKTIAFAVGIGSILINSEIIFGLASFHAKPFIVGGLVLGGLIFGSGMAILGYCPGTMAVSLGEGSLDALTGIIGGLAGGVVYTVFQPEISKILGPDLGIITLNSITGTNFFFFILLIFIGIAFASISFWLQKFDNNKSRKWVVSGIALVILNMIVFSSAASNRVIGASSAYPYVGDLIAGITKNEYFEKLKAAGNWELVFLAGAFAAGLIISVIKKEFRLVLIHESWKRYKGNSSLKRIIWSVTGGFILIFGARMAGGCTSGHILSGGMQLALSSLTFAIFVFTGLLLTGMLFYKTKAE